MLKAGVFRLLQSCNSHLRSRLDGHNSAYKPLHRSQACREPSTPALRSRSPRRSPQLHPCSATPPTGFFPSFLPDRPRVSETICHVFIFKKCKCISQTQSAGVKLNRFNKLAKEEDPLQRFMALSLPESRTEGSGEAFPCGRLETLRRINSHIYSRRRL